MIRAIHLIMLFVVKGVFYLKNMIVTSLLYRFFQKIFHFTYLRYFGVETEFGNVTLVGMPIINRYKKSRIIIGKGVTLVSNSHGNIAGINHPVILATLAEGAVIRIGDRVGISGSSVCAVRGVTIGNNSGLGVNSNIYDTDFHAFDSSRGQFTGIPDAEAKPVKIDENVWIAAHVLILKGVTIGRGAIIGAGSVVRRNVQENTLVIGNPAVGVRMM